MYGVVRIRGQVNISPKVKETFDKLKLRKKHTFTILPETPIYEGMIKAVKDYVAYGKLTDEQVKEILKKKTPEKSKNENSPNVFRLAPPVGGFKKSGCGNGSCCF